jgi:hypothetical protein
MADEERHEEERADELRIVRRNRYQEARRSGMSIVEANLFADSDIDVGELRRLVDADCPSDLLAGVLL